jgi:FkbM family methyltransferase
MLLHKLRNRIFPRKKATIINEYIDKQEIFKHLSANCSVLDCGAHTGKDTVGFLGFTQGPVYAFEAVPAIFRQLKENTKSFTNIHCYPTALAGVSGPSVMHVSGGAGDGSSSLLPPLQHLEDHPEIIFEETIPIDCLTLDDWAAQEGVTRIDLLWLDMQGAEFDMLQASHQLLPVVKAIHTEVSTRETYAGVKQYPALRALLESRGFSVAIEAIPPGYDMGNVLFVRK